MGCVSADRLSKATEKHNSLSQSWLLGAIITCPHHGSPPVVLHWCPPPLGVVGSNSENSHFLVYSHPAPHAHRIGLLWCGSSNFGKSKCSLGLQNKKRAEMPGGGGVATGLCLILQAGLRVSSVALCKHTASFCVCTGGLQASLRYQAGHLWPWCPTLHIPFPAQSCALPGSISTADSRVVTFGLTKKRCRLPYYSGQEIQE